MADTGLVILLQPIEDHLAGLEQRQEERLAAVNGRIASGENEYFQVMPKPPIIDQKTSER